MKDFESACHASSPFQNRAALHSALYEHCATSTSKFDGLLNRYRTHLRLLNYGCWSGKLAKIAKRVNQYGLLSLEDAKTAQALLPEAWHYDPYALATIWALFEVD